MLDSGFKHPENRIHLFDPVGMLNDGYRVVKPPRRPTKSYDSSVDTTNSTGLRSYDKFPETDNTRVELISFDNFTDHTKKTEPLLPYEPSKNDNTNGGGTVSYDETDEGIRLRVKTDEEDESPTDVSTPRLWKPNPTASPNNKIANNNPPPPTKTVTFSPVHPTQHQYQIMSPNSRTQAIAKGRRELMEMVWDLPESFYELSLKDIVEQREEREVKENGIMHDEEKENKKETIISKGKDNTNNNKKKSGRKVKKSESKKKMVRSRSVDNGRFLLKTSVFPIFMGTRKSNKKSVVVSGSSSFKISSMSKAGGGGGGMKGGEKEWWRRKSCISSESDESNGLSSSSTSTRSSRSSSRSNSSNGRRSNRFLPSCFFFNGRRIRGRK